LPHTQARLATVGCLQHCEHVAVVTRGAQLARSDYLIDEGIAQNTLVLSGKQIGERIAAYGSEKSTPAIVYE